MREREREKERESERERAAPLFVYLSRTNEGRGHVTSVLFKKQGRGTKGHSGEGREEELTLLDQEEHKELIEALVKITEGGEDIGTPMDAPEGEYGALPRGWGKALEERGWEGATRGNAGGGDCFIQALLQGVGKKDGKEEIKEFRELGASLLEKAGEKNQVWNRLAPLTNKSIQEFTSSIRKQGNSTEDAEAIYLCGLMGVRGMSLTSTQEGAHGGTPYIQNIAYRLPYIPLIQTNPVGENTPTPITGLNLSATENTETFPGKQKTPTKETGASTEQTQEDTPGKNTETDKEDQERRKEIKDSLQAYVDHMRNTDTPIDWDKLEKLNFDAWMAKNPQNKTQELIFYKLPVKAKYYTKGHIFKTYTSQDGSVTLLVAVGGTSYTVQRIGTKDLPQNFTTYPTFTPIFVNLEKAARGSNAIDWAHTHIPPKESLNILDITNAWDEARKKTGSVLLTHDVYFPERGEEAKLHGRLVLTQRGIVAQVHLIAHPNRFTPAKWTPNITVPILHDEVFNRGEKGDWRLDQTQEDSSSAAKVGDYVTFKLLVMDGETYAYGIKGAALLDTSGLDIQTGAIIRGVGSGAANRSVNIQEEVRTYSPAHWEKIFREIKEEEKLIMVTNNVNHHQQQETGEGRIAAYVELDSLLRAWQARAKGKSPNSFAALIKLLPQHIRESTETLTLLVEVGTTIQGLILQKIKENLIFEENREEKNKGPNINNVYTTYDFGIINVSNFNELARDPHLQKKNNEKLSQINIFLNKSSLIHIKSIENQQGQKMMVRTEAGSSHKGFVKQSVSEASSPTGKQIVNPMVLGTQTAVEVAYQKKDEEATFSFQGNNENKDFMDYILDKYRLVVTQQIYPRASPGRPPPYLTGKVNLGHLNKIETRELLEELSNYPTISFMTERDFEGASPEEKTYLTVTMTENANARIGVAFLQAKLTVMGTYASVKRMGPRDWRIAIQSVVDTETIHQIMQALNCCPQKHGMGFHSMVEAYIHKGQQTTLIGKNKYSGEHFWDPGEEAQDEVHHQTFIITGWQSTMATTDVWELFNTFGINMQDKTKLTWMLGHHSHQHYTLQVQTEDAELANKITELKNNPEFGFTIGGWTGHEQRAFKELVKLPTSRQIIGVKKPLTPTVLTPTQLEAAGISKVYMSTPQGKEAQEKQTNKQTDPHTPYVKPDLPRKSDKNKEGSSPTVPVKPKPIRKANQRVDTEWVHTGTSKKQVHTNKPEDKRNTPRTMVSVLSEDEDKSDEGEEEEKKSNRRETKEGTREEEMEKQKRDKDENLQNKKKQQQERQAEAKEYNTLVKALVSEGMWAKDTRTIINGLVKIYRDIDFKGSLQLATDAMKELMELSYEERKKTIQELTASRDIPEEGKTTNIGDLPKGNTGEEEEDKNTRENIATQEPPHNNNKEKETKKDNKQESKDTTNKDQDSAKDTINLTEEIEILPQYPPPPPPPLPKIGRNRNRRKRPTRKQKTLHPTQRGEGTQANWKINSR